ncbi:MAG TPA: hypothetical protein VGC27_00925, partial [Rhizomicrobium sp.]
MFKRFGAAALAASLLVSSTAFAAANANQGALAQGKPATVKQAESYQGQKYVWWVLGAGVVIGGVALVASGDGHGLVGTPCPFGGCPT